MTEPKRVNIWILLLIAMACVVFVFDVAYGDSDHECQGNSCNGGGDVALDSSTVIGDTIVGGDDALGIGFSMGDVDIGQCIASKSTPVYQWLVENPWCMADSLDARGRHEAAAKVRCSTKTLRRAYPDPVQCEAAVLVAVVVPDVPSKNDSEDDDDEYREQQQTYLGELEGRMDRMESDRKASASRAARQRQEEQKSAQKVLDAYQEKGQ
ncbi:MAG: hypothetical protein V3S12_00300 [Acidiferrobacterales bacterium]